MKQKKLFLILVCIGLVSVFLTVFAYNSYFVKEIISTEMLVSVTSGGAGFDVTAERMSFGQIPAGNSARRQVTIDNFDLDPILIQVKLTGEMADWVGVSDNLFILEPGMSKNLTSFLNVPRDVAPGQYSGMFMVYYLRT